MHLALLHRISDAAFPGLEFPNFSSIYNLKPVTRGAEAGLEKAELIFFFFIAEHNLSSISFLLIFQTFTGFSLCNPSQFPGFNRGMRGRSEQENPGSERSVSLQLEL